MIIFLGFSMMTVVVSFVLVTWIIKREKWTGKWTLKPVIIVLSKTLILRNKANLYQATECVVVIVSK